MNDVILVLIITIIFMFAFLIVFSLLWAGWSLAIAKIFSDDRNTTTYGLILTGATLLVVAVLLGI